MNTSRETSATLPSGLRPPTVATLTRRFYPDAAAADPVGLFVRRLERVVKRDDVVLDLGAGAGELNSYDLKARARRVLGIDVDRRVGSNPLLHYGFPADISSLPFRDNSIDIAFSIYVFEHVEHPAPLIAEIYRVLRPGGLCLFLTPNVFHYVTVASRFSPMWFHEWFNERRGRRANDTFPTFYRLNSRGALTRSFGAAGFDPVSIDLIEVPPNYLRATAATFALGIAYERIVNSSERLAALRVNLIGMFQKPLRLAGASNGR